MSSIHPDLEKVLGPVSDARGLLPNQMDELGRSIRAQVLPTSAEPTSRYLEAKRIAAETGLLGVEPSEVVGAIEWLNAHPDTPRNSEPRNIPSMVDKGSQRIKPEVRERNRLDLGGWVLVGALGVTVLAVVTSSQEHVASSTDPNSSHTTRSVETVAQAPKDMVSVTNKELTPATLQYNKNGISFNFPGDWIKEDSINDGLIRNTDNGYFIISRHNHFEDATFGTNNEAIKWLLEQSQGRVEESEGRIGNLVTAVYEFDRVFKGRQDRVKVELIPLNRRTMLQTTAIFNNPKDQKTLEGVRSSLEITGVNRDIVVATKELSK